MATTLPMKTPLILLRHFYFLNHTRALFPHPFSFHKSVNPNSWPGLEKNKVPWITWNCWFWKFLNYKTSNFLWSNLIVFYWKTVNPVVMFSSVAQSCLTVCDPMDCSILGFSVLHYLPEFGQTHVHRVSDAIQLILCCPLLLLPSTFPCIRVFSSKSAFHIWWPKYWSFQLQSF